MLRCCRADIKDAYGLPLEESEAYFFTTEPAQDLSYPQLSSGSQVENQLLRLDAPLLA